jgi:hypothetical protein
MRSAGTGPDPAPGRAALAPSGLVARGPLSAGWKLCISAGALGAEGGAGYLYRPLGAVLITVDVIVPLAVGLILLVAIMRGSDRTCDRGFRLLRWITNRPEPPAPPPQPGITGPEQARRG